MSENDVPDFHSWLDGVRPEIDDALDRYVPPAVEPPARIHEAMRYSLFAGGKRVRPALVLLAGEILGAGREALLAGGAALEMIHTYSLIHDDLPALDDDDLRRGRPTLHKRTDEATAILAGDGLLTLGLTLLAAEPPSQDPATRRRAVEMVGRAIGTRGMIGGQVDDLEAETTHPDDPAATLEAIHRRKTGALLVACLRLAGIYSAVDEATDDVLRRLGEAIGLLFQIADDILDVEGTDEKLGKTAGKDEAVDKLTYPALYGLDGARERLEAERRRALGLVAELPAAGLFPSFVSYLVERDH